MKLCNSCETTKPDSEFHCRKASNDGLAARCKECLEELVVPKEKTFTKAEIDAKVAEVADKIKEYFRLNELHRFPNCALMSSNERLDAIFKECIDTLNSKHVGGEK
ncbi:MAG: hypothetical protein QM500_19340 [Methylococcales bacterium]